MAQTRARAGGWSIDDVGLSPRMLDEALANGRYRELHVAELIQFTTGRPVYGI